MADVNGDASADIASANGSNIHMERSTGSRFTGATAPVPTASVGPNAPIRSLEPSPAAPDRAGATHPAR